MAQPTPGDLYVQTLLTNVLVAWMQDQRKFGATRLFPSVPTALPAGIVPQYKIGDLYRVVAKKRASGTEAVEVGWNTDNTLSFLAEERAFKKLVTDQDRGAAQQPYDPDTAAARFVAQLALISLENDFISTFWKTGLWGKDWTGANTADSTHKVYWDVVGSTPIEDVKQELDRIEGVTGYRPQKLALGATVYTGLENNPEFVDRIKYGGTPGQPAIVNEQAMAQVFGVDEIVRIASVSNTAVEGATDSISFMAGKSAFLCYAAPAPGMYEPSAGYIFPWTGPMGAAGTLAYRVKKYRWEVKEGDYVEAQGFYDMKAVATSLGTFFSNISST